MVEPVHQPWLKSKRALKGLLERQVRGLVAQAVAGSQAVVEDVG